MTILETFIKLRDDLKLWVTNNLNQKANISYVDEKFEEVDLSEYATQEYVDEGLVGLATETYVDTAVASLVNSAPEALNTLDELAAALGDDENFATTVTNQIASKQDTITGTAGQFVVIGADGKPTTKTIPNAREATF